MLKLWRQVIFIALFMGKDFCYGARFECHGPLSDVTDNDCQEVKFQATKGCYHGGPDNLWISCAYQCNNKDETSKDGQVCLDYCQSYRQENCKRIVPVKITSMQPSTSMPRTSLSSPTKPDIVLSSSERSPEQVWSIAGPVSVATLMITALAGYIICKKCKRCRQGCRCPLHNQDQVQFEMETLNSPQRPMLHPEASTDCKQATDDLQAVGGLLGAERDMDQPDAGNREVILDMEAGNGPDN